MNYPIQLLQNTGSFCHICLIDWDAFPPIWSEWGTSRRKLLKHLGIVYGLRQRIEEGETAYKENFYSAFQMRGASGGRSKLRWFQFQGETAEQSPRLRTLLKNGCRNLEGTVSKKTLQYSPTGRNWSMYSLLLSSPRSSGTGRSWLFLFLVTTNNLESCRTHHYLLLMN